MVTDCRVWGAGSHKVIGIHGWFGPTLSWSGLGQWINPSAYTWLLPHLRGYGSRRKDWGNHTLDEVVDDIIAMADAHGWDSFSLVGHSMGGVMAQRVLARYPGRVRKLVGITPVPASGIPFDEGTRQFFSSAADQFERRRMILDSSTGSRLHPDVISKMHAASLLETSSDAFSGYFAVWSGANFVDQLKGSTTPVKVIVGANDPHVTAEFMQATYGTLYRRCEIVRVEGAGHYPALETPLQLVGEIERFLGS